MKPKYLSRLLQHARDDMQKRILRSCICLCVTSILIVACIQVLLYPLLTRIPPVYSMNAQDNDEIQNFYSCLDYNIDAIHERLKRAYTGDVRNVTDFTPIYQVYAAIDRIQNGYNIFYFLQRRPHVYTDITSFLSVQLLDDSWDYLKILLFLWIFALVCIFIATILQPYCAGALCGVLWCCIGAITLTWLALQFADACMIPTYPMRSPPYDWTYREMRSILKEYERMCREFAAEFAARFSDYPDRYEDALKVILEVQRAYRGWGIRNRQFRDFAKAMYVQVDDASHDLMSNNITLSCQYNASSHNNHFPSHLPEYDRVIRYVCHESRKLQVLILQILILMLAPIICLCILVYAIIIIEPGPYPLTPCPDAKCDPCVETTVKSCSLTRQCGGIVPCSEIDTCPGPLPKKPKGYSNYIRDQIDRAQTVNTICNPVNIACAYQPFSTGCQKLSLSNPVSSVQIRSGIGRNYCPATVLCESTRQNCARRDKYSDALFRSVPIMVSNSTLDCSTSFSNSRLKLYSTLISESKFNLGPTRFLESRATSYTSFISQSKQDICNVRALESKSTLFPSPISGSEYLILNTSISESRSFLPTITKCRQKTSVQSDTENKTSIPSTIPKMKQNVCVEKITNRDNSKVVLHPDSKQRRFEGILNSKSFIVPVTSRRSFCTENNISKALSFLYPLPPVVSEHSSWTDGEVTKLNVCSFSARLSQSSDSNQKITKSKSGVFPFTETKSRKKYATEIFENKHGHTSSATLLSDQDVLVKFSVHSPSEESKQSIPFPANQIKSVPLLGLHSPKKHISILRPKSQHTYCSQCGSHIEYQSELKTEEYLYFRPKNASCGCVPKPLVSDESNNHDKALIERKRPDRNLQLHQFDSSLKFNHHVNISRPMPGLNSLRKSESKSNVSSAPLSLSGKCHSSTVKLKPAFKFPSKIPIPYHKVAPRESQHSICPGCKSNVDCGSKVHLCVAPRSTSRVRLCLTPTHVSVVPIGLSSFAAETLCGNPKCTREPRCVCKKKIIYSPSSGTPRKSILVKNNSPRRQRAPNPLVSLPPDTQKMPLTSILKKP